MQNRGLSSLLEYLRRELPLPGPDLVPDDELISRFIETKDQAAFELLVRRHGPMVFGVARRMLRNEHAAEDVLQATFLALARQANSLPSKHSIAGWLYRVAVRISTRARSKKLVAVTDLAHVPAPKQDLEQNEMKATLDTAIERLPEKLRRAVVLCYMSGYTTEQAGRLLDCPKGTVLSRLAAAREKLQSELTRKGIVVSTATLTSALTTELTSAALPSALVAIAMKAIGPAATLTPIVITLAQGAITMSWIKVTLLGVLVLTTGFGLTLGMAKLEPQRPVEKNQAKDNPLIAQVSTPKTQSNPEVDTPPYLKTPLYIIQLVDNDLTKLLKDRANCAIRELQLRYEEFQTGRGTLDVLMDTSKRIRDARLDLAANSAERVDIRKQYLEVVRSIDTLNEQRFNSSEIKEQDLLMSRYFRLDAEIELKREQSKSTGQP